VRGYQNWRHPGRPEGYEAFGWLSKGVVCSESVRAGLLELAGATALAIAGVGLWALPPETPVIGRPPTLLGWLCIVIAALIAILSTANFLGLDFQVPIRRRVPTEPKQVQPPVPIPINPAPQPVPAPHPVPAPVATDRIREPYSDAKIEALIELGKTPNLTGVQMDTLLAPYKGKWIVIQGEVKDVDKPLSGWVKATLSKVNGDARLAAITWFTADQMERAAALHRGASVRVLGKVLSIHGTSDFFSLDDCELTT
jgi:hypothetical protein